jgi:very-short-patch-repair endonuclease
MTLENARKLRKNATECERLLWLHLRAHRLQGFKFKRQQPIGPYIVDFVCLEARCIVEADGGQHSEQAEYDARRDHWFRSQGFIVLRFWNNDILNNTEGVLATIFAACRDYVNSPSPQPLPHQGGGAKESVPVERSGPDLGVASSENTASAKSPELPPGTETTSSPLPLRERGRGRGGKGL